MWSECLYFQEFRKYQKQQGLQPSHGKQTTHIVTNIAQVITIKFLNMLTLYPKLLAPSYLNLKPLITAVSILWRDFAIASSHPGITLTATNTTAQMNKEFYLSITMPGSIKDCHCI